MEVGDYILSLVTSPQEKKVPSTNYIGGWLEPTTSLKFLPY
jgi:hypothetical protein